MAKPHVMTVLRDKLVETYNLEELDGLCFQWGLDSEKWPPSGKVGKVQHLLYELDRNGRIDELLVTLHKQRPGLDWPSLNEDPKVSAPFKGLDDFHVEDAHLFFGREALTMDLVKDVTDNRFLVVIGASGSGKSSLVQAGVIASLQSCKPLADGSPPPFKLAPVLTHIIRPGAHPLRSLAISLTQGAESVTAIQMLIDDMAANSRSLDLYTARLIDAYEKTQPQVTIPGQTQRRQRLVIVVDQFEELFTECKDRTEQQAFVSNLVYATAPTTDGVTTVILTLRADFYSQCFVFEDMLKLLEVQQRTVRRMTNEELRTAIEGPALREGWAFESGLIEAILNDVGDDIRVLPLLSHALLETWKRRKGCTMTLAGYEDAGRLEGAIGRTAESVYAAFSPAEQAIARNILLRLVNPGEGTEDTRRRATLAELIPRSDEGPAIQSVLKRLADMRLITTDRESVELTHEALVRKWPEFQRWLSEDREGLRLQQHLAEAAGEWDAKGRSDEGLLYRGGRLEDATRWVGKYPDRGSALERDFLAASQAAIQRVADEKEVQQQRSGRRRRILLSVSTVIAILAASVAAWAIWQTQQANNQQILGRSRGIAALVISQIAMGNDTERGLLLAMEAISVTQAAGLPYTFEAADALRQALFMPHLSAYLVGHEARVLSAQFSPNGRSIVTASADNTARVWNAATGKQITLLRGHEGEVTSAQFSPDSKSIVTASADKTARVWDAATGKQITLFRGHEDRVLDAQFSPDGKSIVTTSADKSARVWDAATGKQIALLSGHKDYVYTAQFSPDGESIVTVGADNTARMWNAATGRQTALLRGYEDHVLGAQFSPDGESIVTASGGFYRSDNTARVWDAATGEQIALLRGHEDYVASAQFSPDSKSIVTASYDGTARVWDAATGKQIALLRGHEDHVLGAQFSPDGKSIVTVSSDNTVRMWDAATGKQTALLSGHEAHMLTAEFSPDGKSIVTVSSDNIAQVWEAVTDKQMILSSILPSSYESYVTSADYSPDGRFIATASADGTVQVWDVVTGHKTDLFGGHDTDIYIAQYSPQFSPDSKSIVTVDADNSAQVWDAATGRKIALLSGHDGHVYSAQFSRDGKSIVTASADNTARVWNATTGKQIALLSGHEGYVYSAQYSPDGKYIITISTNNIARTWDSNLDMQNIRMWDAATYEQIALLSGHERYITSAQFAPDSKSIVTASYDGTARVWDTATGKQITLLRGHEGEVYSVQFSRDGSSIVTAGADGTTRVWDAVTGQQIALIRGHKGKVYTAQFSPDDKSIVTASADETAMISLVRIDDLMALALSRVTRTLTCRERVTYLNEPLDCSQMKP